MKDAIKDAIKTIEAWGDKPSTHPDFVKAHYKGTHTGEYISHPIMRPGFFLCGGCGRLESGK